MDPRSAAPDLDSTAGLGLVGFRLLPHLDSEPFTEVTRKILDRYGDDGPMRFKQTPYPAMKSRI